MFLKRLCARIRHGDLSMPFVKNTVLVAMTALLPFIFIGVETLKLTLLLTFSTEIWRIVPVSFPPVFIDINTPSLSFCFRITDGLSTNLSVSVASELDMYAYLNITDGECLFNGEKELQLFLGDGDGLSWCFSDLRFQGSAWHVASSVTIIGIIVDLLLSFLSLSESLLLLELFVIIVNYCCHYYYSLLPLLLLLSLSLMLL